MMLASGAGSYFSTRLVPGRGIMQRILMMIFLLLLLYTFFLSPLLNKVDSYPGFVKIAISLVLVAGPAILMGMPFPLGLRRQAMKEEKNLPWAWGINGCVSVISASLAALLTVEAGFAAVILLAAIFYGLSMLSMYLTRG
jgi:hypothetical protein